MTKPVTASELKNVESAQACAVHNGAAPAQVAQHSGSGSNPIRSVVQAMSALTPKADIGTQPRNVRFGPKADSCTTAILSLFDHQVGAAKQRKRHGKAEGLGSFQVDDQLDLGGLMNWKIGRFLPLENPAGVFPE